MSHRDDFKRECNRVRALCRAVEQETRDLTPMVSDLPAGVELQEVNANLMLAVRHLEDARMRLGKAIQYGCEDGVSCFDAQPRGAGE